MDERLTRLEDAFTYLVVMISEGRRGWFENSRDPKVVEACQRGGGMSSKDRQPAGNVR